MGALSFHSPLTILSPPPRPNRRRQSFPPNCFSFTGVRHTRRFLCRSGNRREPEEAPFFDEDGVVKDMDGYLNYLSLEYDSIWDTKPAWCQPWTILLTGGTVTVCSWVLLRSLMITAAVFSLICTWWYIFLYAYPKAYSNMIAKRRENVTSGVEDTFGLKKNM